MSESPKDSVLTLTLTDFLLARIAEDEAVAQAAASDTAWSRAHLAGKSRGVREEWCSAIDPARVLAECEAKRRIVALNDADYPTLNDAYGCDDSCAIPYVLRLLALPYADHPDYRQEWKP